MLLRLAAAYAAALLVPSRWWPLALAPLLVARSRRRLDLGLAPALALAACLGRLDRGPAPPSLEPEGQAVVARGWIAAAPEVDARFSSSLLEIESMQPVRAGAESVAAHAWIGQRVRLGARLGLPAYGSRIVARGRLRPPRPARNFDGNGERGWLAAAGAVATLEADSVARLPGKRGPAWRRELLEPLRVRLGNVIASTLAPREAGLLAALVVGQRGGVDAETRNSWAALGINHILSISGMHVALVAGGLLALCGSPRRRRGLVGFVIGIWAYAAIGGLGPTVLRASLMATWAALALYLGRSHRPLFALGIAALALVLQAPGRRADLGLQLSCLATAGLLIASPAVAALATRLGSGGPVRRSAAWAAGAAGVGLAAQTATLPLQIARFGMLSWCSPLANLVMVPLSDAALVLALVGAPLALAVESAGRPLLLASGALLHVGCRLAVWVTQSTETRLFPRVDSPVVASASLLACTLLVAIAALGAGRRRAAMACLAGAGLGLLLLFLALVREAAPGWRFEALDVGQGDAFVLTLDSSTWVVDAGDLQPADCGARVVLPHLRRSGVHRLRGLVLTHPHRDHCGGARSLLGGLAVDTLYVGSASSADSEYARLRREFPSQPVRSLVAGTQLALAPDYTATVLWPESTDVLAEGANGCSVVLWARGPGRPELLLMGDLEKDGEARVGERWALPLAGPRDGDRILKVGHHGSSTSSSPAFLAIVKPDVALVSVGEHNRFHQPSPSTLAALASRVRLVLRTDRGGAVRLQVRGDALWLERPETRPQLLPGWSVDGPAQPP